ncbi:hypothetical protein ACLOJK_018874 [Asimina triloba]
MDIAIGMHFNDWDAERKLGYMESTLVGNAKKTWAAFKNIMRYVTFKTKFLEANSRGSSFGDRPAAGTAAGGATVAGRQALERHPPRHGPHNPEATIHATQNSTEISAAPPLKIGGGDIGLYTIHPAILHQTPRTWGEAMTKGYDEISPLDTLGRRIAYVIEKLTNQCIDWRLKESARGDMGRICAQVEIPRLTFGCDKPIRRPVRRKPIRQKPIRRKRKVILKFQRYKRKPGRKPKKTRFVRKKRVAKGEIKPQEKSTAGVKCFGCQQLGHYTNKCLSKTTAKAVKFIEEEFNMVIFSDYESDDNISLYEIDFDYEYIYEDDLEELGYQCLVEQGKLKALQDPKLFGFNWIKSLSDQQLLNEARIRDGFRVIPRPTHDEQTQESEIELLEAQIKLLKLQIRLAEKKQNKNQQGRFMFKNLFLLHQQ